MLKNVKKEDCIINIELKVVSVIVKLFGGSDYSLEFDLVYEIIFEKFVSKIMFIKIEIKFWKFEER